jgi:hypothetical protein
MERTDASLPKVVADKPRQCLSEESSPVPEEKAEEN